MKRLFVLFVVVSLLVGLESATAFANSCTLPSFIKEGVPMTLRHIGQKNVQCVISKVDKNSCWVYVQLSEDPEDCEWFNINNVDVIKPYKKGD